ncbi:MAG: DUF1570 domain-containing protein [Archangium sp.]
MMRVLAVCGVVFAGCATTSGSSSALGDVRRNSLVFDEVAQTAPTRWRAVETKQFSLISDLPPEQMKEAASSIAQSLAGLKAMFGKAPVAREGSLTIVALADGIEFERVFSSKVGGIAISSEKGTWVFVYGAPSRWFQRPVLTQDASTSVLQHELAHAVLRNYFLSQPRWFAEGMAQYLETYRWVDAENIVLGEVNYEAYSRYRKIRSLGIADLKQWSGPIQHGRDMTTSGLYGNAWAFVHWALNREQQRFGQFMYGLTQVGGEEAWAKTFAPIEPSIDTAVHQYMKVGEYFTVNAHVPLTEPAHVKIEAVSEDDAKALEAILVREAEESAK